MHTTITKPSSNPAYTATVLTISDKGAAGQRQDTAGPTARALLEDAGFVVSAPSILPDEAERISAALIHAADIDRVHLVLTVGGTGFAPRDVTPEATIAVCERMTPGLTEAMRAESLKITSRAMLSRATAGIRGRTLIVNLPGSEKAARENLLAILDALPHGLDLLRETSGECGVPVAPQ
jgi:molybdenum cofactor synthesis domain-containing protein